MKFTLQLGEYRRETKKCELSEKSVWTYTHFKCNPGVISPGVNLLPEKCLLSLNRSNNLQAGLKLNLSSDKS